MDEVASQWGSSEIGVEVVAGKQVEKPQALFPRIEEEATVWEVRNAEAGTLIVPGRL